ncbi:DUF4365 domain-containing protein [Dyadobacter sp. LJ419]|uniref:DUF4365 domain-containing protein n=2 Tax=Dyadobacter chenwenxiniae TaxID=2906456 RepID=A0A9X1PHY3_9BACT|nr:DUF4365 domain-containing protein [Dyadobacter chenwenxiniae]MCF0059856.1 DUF4365 domain-containing protein [Dyadobacter chenwenxiniae]
MSKIVRASHIIAERGVNVFADYCNRHNPYIIWREETKNDFGIDGEIELTEKTDDGKTKPTSRILKVQVKSTEHDNSYMIRETEDSFCFSASESDLEYWNNYRRFGYEVLLVIFDGRKGNEYLYCKKITDIDVALSTKKGRQKAAPIQFSKIDNHLTTGSNEFLDRFASSFKPRLNHSVSEIIDSNLWPFRSEPRWMYSFSSRFKNKKALFSEIQSGIAPYFIIKDSFIYTFTDARKGFKEFFDQASEDGCNCQEHRFNDIVSSSTLKNYYVELMNAYISDFMRRRGMWWQKDYKRYYFYLKEDQQEHKVSFKTRKIAKETEKKVVGYYEYGKDHFFRHWAINVKIVFIENKLYLVLNHKYLFTSDRRTPIRPDKITKYTNYINSRTYNDGVLDELHFWWYHFAKNNTEWMIFDGKNLQHPDISVGRPICFDVPFGIAMDSVRSSAKTRPPVNENSQQLAIFL